MDSTLMETPISLKRLIDIPSYTEVCRTLIHIQQVGISLFDVDGERIIDIPVGESGGGSPVVDIYGTCDDCCTESVAETDSRSSSKPTLHRCANDTRYLSLDILLDGDIYGKIVMGPYIEAGVDSQKPTEALPPRSAHASTKDLTQSLQHLGSVTDAIIHMSQILKYTSDMHMQAMQNTHDKLMEKHTALKESMVKLQELELLKSNFLAGVSHELRTPLTSIIGYSEALLEAVNPPLSTSQKEYVQKIVTRGDELLNLITALMDITKIEYGKIELSLEMARLDDLIQSSLESITAAAAKKKIEIQAKVDSNLPEVRVDRKKIIQCIMNLLGNAVKFTPEGGVVTIQASRYQGPRRRYNADIHEESGYSVFEQNEESFVLISVHDQGIGIDNKEREIVFEAFYQVDNSSTRSFGGIGIGLAIVRSYIDAHDGEVWVDESGDRGTVFSLLLPIDN